MKKIVVKFWILTGLLLAAAGCETDDIGFYKEGNDAVRFPMSNTLEVPQPSGYNPSSGIFYASWSFIEFPFINDTILDVPVMLIGHTSDKERTVAYRIDEEKTTAPAGSYTILEAVIPPDSIVGYIRFQLFNREELNDSTYQVHLTLGDSEELSVGPKEYINALLSWNNTIPMPPHTHFIRTYNMLINSSLNFISTSTANFSTNALKTIVAAMEWNDWDDFEKHGAKYNSTVYGSYKYLPRYNMIYTDNSYKSYALKLADYIKAYNEANPDAPLKHDAGGLQGQLIVARKY